MVNRFIIKDSNGRVYGKFTTTKKEIERAVKIVQLHNPTKKVEFKQIK